MSAALKLPAPADNAQWQQRGINIAAARQHSVFLATPVYDKIDLNFHISSIATLDLLKKLGIEHQIGFIRGVPVADARNMLVSQFLESGMSDLLFIDCDQGWSPLDIVRLLGHSLPLVGAVGRKKVPGSDSDRANWCLQDLENPCEQQQAYDSVIEMAGIGTGMMLINRCVFDLLKAAHPEWERDPIHAGAKPYFEYFACDLANEGRRRVSEDMTFCNRYRAIGGRIFADMSIAFAHYGQTEFGGRVSPGEALKVF